ncbi:hypothetical protein, partial [Streptococcus pneumoniae]|uniref:hypothetical protein n=1 Tax=Streptococcus pneumoniae TaxID=1313 RepID=UPI001E3E0E61
ELYRVGLTYERLKDEILKISAGEKIELAFVDPALRAKASDTGVSGLETLNGQQQIYFFPADNNRANGWGRVRDYLRVRQDADGRPYS